MKNQGKNNRLNHVMDMLGVRANTLAQQSGADHSLLTKWRRGDRKLTLKSKNLHEISAALLEMDSDGELLHLIAPYAKEDEAPADTLCAYLVGKDLPALPPRMAPAERRRSGEYTVEHRVYLGHKGFRSATIAMLGYTMALPPGREIVAVCHDKYNWIVQSPSYAVLLVDHLRRAFERGTTLTIINRKGSAVTDVASFAGPWLAAHLHGYIRSRYYEGDAPPGEQIVASIRDYWSLRAHEDPEVDDQLFAAMFTDPLDTRQDVKVCDEYYARSKSTSQYSFFRDPLGTGAERRLWADPARLPPLEGIAPVDGSFHSIQRLPCMGIMTVDEVRQVTGLAEPAFPTFLFAPGAEFAPGPHKLILCLEDVRKALTRQKTPHGPLGDLCRKPVSIPRETTAAMLRRLLAAMDKNPRFEVALVPRVAFRKLQLELVAWQGSYTLSWLQDHSQSALMSDFVSSGSVYGWVEYLWGRLLAGWKRQDRVRRQLRKWLAGKDLDSKLTDSAIVRGWDIYPRQDEASD